MPEGITTALASGPTRQLGALQAQHDQRDRRSDREGNRALLGHERCGTIEIGPRERGGFRVRVAVPLEVAAADPAAVGAGR